MFGNGRSSSPSNTPAPFHGPDFPLTTIRDNVDAVHRLLTEQLHIRHLRAVIGFSMGAQQAFQWAVSYPDFMDRVVATSGTARTYGHGIVRLQGQIATLELDPAFQAGRYTTEPTAGIEATALVWLGWLYSQEWWRRDLWKTENPPGTTLQHAIDTYKTEFFKGADANNLILQMRTWQHHDVGATPPFHNDTPGRLALHQGAGALHALGHRPVFPGGGRVLRSRVHRALHAGADPLAVGASGGRGGQPGGCRVSECADWGVHGRQVRPSVLYRVIKEARPSFLKKRSKRLLSGCRGLFCQRALGGGGEQTRRFCVLLKRTACLAFETFPRYARPQLQRNVNNVPPPPPGATISARCACCSPCA